MTIININNVRANRVSYQLQSEQFCIPQITNINSTSRKGWHNKFLAAQVLKVIRALFVYFGVVEIPHICKRLFKFLSEC